MTSDCRSGRIAHCARWICIAALLSGLSACGGGDSQAPQAIGSDGDNVESAPPIAEQQPDPAPPQPECKTDDPAGSEIVLLAGQSNANTGLLAAIDTTLTDQDTAYMLGHYYVGGYPISGWMLEDGTPGPLWAPMIGNFDAVIEKVVATGSPVNALTFIWFQGESDVYPNTYPYYEARLRQLVRTIEVHAENNWSNLPGPVFSIAQPEDVSATFRVAMDSIRESIAIVSGELKNACAFDTQDIRRVDTVHIPNFPSVGSPEQFVVADRALACGRVAANRCNSREKERQ